MKIYNRKTKSMVDEIEYGKKALEWLYNTFIGRIVLKLFASRRYFSKVRSIYQKSKRSKKDISSFIKKYNIDTADWNFKDFKCFNDFFIRKKDVVFCNNPEVLIAPAESKMSVYKIEDNLKLRIKNSDYDLSEILEDENLASEFSNGLCLIFRLTVDNYHRYIVPDAGEVIKNYKLNGVLHTIRPIAAKYRTFCRNCREVTVMETENFGKMVYVEVGAMLVGAIKNRQCTHFLKGEEKGWFEYGGSTIVLILKNNVKIDEDILNHAQKGIEVCVEIGERIGIKCLKH